MNIIDTIIRDVCETDRADPCSRDTVCIDVEDLRVIIANNLAPTQGADKRCDYCGNVLAKDLSCKSANCLHGTQGADERIAELERMLSGERGLKEIWKQRAEEWCAQATQGADARPALTDEQVEKGWRATFSTGNPYCPCNLTSFTKAVRWAERTIMGGAKS